MNKNLTLKQVIDIADKVYPDGLVGQAVKGKKVGDGLAEFIACELKETYDPKATRKAQLEEARRVMSRAHTEVGDVATAFSDALIGVR